MNVKRIVVGYFGCLFSCLLCASSPTVTFTDECHCTDCHGVARWTAKTDPEMPPNADDAIPNPIQPITPSEMFRWQRPAQKINESSERVPEEEQWFAMRGEVVEVRVEQDGDIHVVLKDEGAPDQTDGLVGCEIPVPGNPSEPEADEQWCKLRMMVFSWTTENFPFHFESGKTLKLLENPTVIIVTGKAFFDIDHAPKDGSNLRTGTRDYSVWEIHPVMDIEVVK